MHGDASLCLVHFAGRVKLKHLSCSPRPRPTALAKQVSSETAPWHFTLLKLLGVLGHLSDTSQSTPDRTRYICTVCTLWLPLPIYVDAPSGRRETTVQVQPPMKLNPLLTPQHPALAAVTSPLCHPTVVFECLRIISLLHRHGRSVFQQRVLSPLSSSIRPARGLSAAMRGWLLRRKPR